METDIKYKLRHLGDMFLDKITGLTNQVKASGKGIVLTYSIDKDKKEKDKLTSRIGRRVIILRNKGEHQNIMNDPVLVKLFYRLDTIQDRIDNYIKERKERQN
ncbi:MAG: hypothetical protein HQK77_14835 [Desulfobacterales bacterium]|nr:hypothetical protein [Desulfobacterales bacterium]